MWNNAWYCDIRWTLVVLLLHTSGQVTGRDDKSRNIPSISQSGIKRTQRQTEQLDSIKTRAIHESDSDLTNKNTGVPSGSLGSIGGNLYQQTPQTFGNNPSLTEELNQRNSHSGNALNRFVDKLGRGGGEGGSSNHGNGRRGDERTQPSVSEVGEQRVREEMCCIRRPHDINIGYDALGKAMSLDVGKCRRMAKSVVAHLALVGSNPLNMQELRERIANSQTQCTTCGSRDSCSASESRIERLHLHGELKEVPVVEECLCVPKPSSCQRVSQHQTFFPGSPYESKVDVGLCLGHCKSQDGTQTHCRPTRNRTVTVEGPMGQHCVETVESCECAPECYRASYVESYYAMEWNATLNSTQEVIKEIDVGRCAGGCESSRSLKCLLGSGQTPGTCLMGLYGQTSCSPRSYTNHEFNQRNGKRTAVISIDTCQCQ